jgi:threonine dehydrogenase-like Zn-dependent dehydrogenase
LLIVGDGPIGLLTLILARRAGVPEVWLVGGRDRRLALARELGAARVLDHRAGDVAAQLAAAGTTPSQIVEATGVAAALATTLAAAPRGARLLVLGDYGEAVASFHWNLLLHRELTLLGSNASAGAWPAAVQAATDCAADVARLITHRLPAAQFAQGIALMRRQDPATVKVVLRWD